MPAFCDMVPQMPKTVFFFQISKGDISLELNNLSIKLYYRTDFHFVRLGYF